MNCPECGSPAEILFISTECTSPFCKYYRKPTEPEPPPGFPRAVDVQLEWHGWSHGAFLEALGRVSVVPSINRPECFDGV